MADRALEKADGAAGRPGIAVVGMGYWGKNLVRNFRTLNSLAAVCDSDPSVEARCISDYPGVRYVANYDNVLTDPSITGVVLATPARSHFQLARAALLSGKDVFVEKPLALEVAQGEELVHLADINHRVLMVGHILQYHPAIIKLRDLIRDGTLGRIQYVYSNRLNIGKIRTEEDILWSFAPHDVSALVALLDEAPDRVASQGGAYLNRHVYDVTLSYFSFPSGVSAHIFVSWLHPFKEQRLVVVGSERMAVFDDTGDQKLVLYPHKVQWRNRVPTAVKAEAELVAIEHREPLWLECEHFLDCIESRATPVTSGHEGLRVLRILDACARSLMQGGALVTLTVEPPAPEPEFFVHESAYVDDGAEIGQGTKVWHFSHIMKGAVIGQQCVIGQNVNIDGGAFVGDNVKIQNNVSVYGGVTVEDDVFLGPSCVLTNVTNPRAQVNRRTVYEKTTLRRGCTVGANATIICGVSVGCYAFVAAGSVVTRDVPDYALMIGNPARQAGWMSRHGHRLSTPDSEGVMTCPESGYRYRLGANGQLRCLDLDEDKPLPAEMRTGTIPYGQLKSRRQ